MPTIAQLPTAPTVTAADLVPLSQSGATRAASIGELLATTQPAILVDTQSLLGRTSLGSGSPEGVAVGVGLGFNSGTLVANGADHATFQATGSLSSAAELVISQQGSPMLMPATLLRGIFSAGDNITIDINGTISAAGSGPSSPSSTGSITIGDLQILNGLSAQDLLIADHGGTNCAVTYGNLINGVTIDQGPAASAASDTDMVWVSQGGSAMTCQKFSAIWSWITNKYLAYKTPVFEIAVNTILDGTLHNNHLLICSQAVTLTPSVGNMGSGFQCTVLNASSGSVILGSGFISSTNSLIINPWQSANIVCATYSGGTLVFANISGSGGTSISPPGPASSLTLSGITATSITVSWLAPTSGGAATTYIVQFRVTGTSAWTSSSSVTGTTSYQITALQAGTSYDVAVQAINAGGNGPLSSTVTSSTLPASQAPTVPVVTGLTASVVSSSSIQLTWSASGGTAQSFTVQYRITGATVWTTLSGLMGSSTFVQMLQSSTSYDFVVYGVNSAGSGANSNTVTAITSTAPQPVSSITWNVVPSSSYTHNSGSIGLNVHVSPGTAAVQFGLSSSATTPPTAWTTATYVNSDLWGVYLPTPSTTGTWYAWVEGLDGSAATVSSPFTVS